MNAMRNEMIVGLTSFGPATHAVFGLRGEVKHLYVDPTCKRQGIGQRLLQAAFGRMAADGFDAAALAVVRDNQRLWISI